MLYGWPPFSDLSDRVVKKEILKGFNPKEKKGPGCHFNSDRRISSSAKDLISRLLTHNTAKRLTATEALEHRWLLSESKKSLDLPIDLKTVQALAIFEAGCKFKVFVKLLFIHFGINLSAIGLFFRFSTELF